MDADCDAREEKFQMEEQARNDELAKDLKRAEEEHEARIKAIRDQDRIHSEAATKKRPTNWNESSS